MFSKLFSKIGLGFANNYKTYAFLIGWAAYKFSVANGWMNEHPDLETTLLTGAGLSARDAIGKNPAAI